MANHKDTPQMDQQLAEMIDAILDDAHVELETTAELDVLMDTIRSLKDLSDAYPGPSESMSKRSIEIKQAYRKAYQRESRDNLFNLSFSLTTASSLIGAVALIVLVVIVAGGGGFSGGGIAATASSPTFVITSLVFLVALISAVAFFFRKK